MFLLTMFLFILPQNVLAGKYDEAIKTTTTAIAKQSGLEADFLKFKSASEKRITKWARENKLQTPLTVVSFVAPIVIRKQIRFRTGDFTFKGNSSKLSVDWQIQF